MTVLDNTPRDQYTASGGQVAFTYTFEIAAEGDIAVLQNGTLLNLGAGAGEYAVTGVGVDTGGVVTLVTAATAGDIITLYRDMALDRLTSYTNGGDFLAADVNNDFDRLWLALQQNTGVSDRALVAPNTDPTSINMTIPAKADREGKFLSFDSVTGNPTVTSISDVFGSGTLKVYNFVGDGATTAFTLGSDPGVENNTQVYIDGVYQQKNGYTVSGTTLTFSAAPPNLSTIEVMVIQPTAINTTDAASVSFTQAGSNDTRTVQAKLEESVSVLDFGADPTGVADSAAAINAAFAAGKNSVYMPAGVYKILSTVTIADYCSLRGAGHTSENGTSDRAATVILKSFNGVGLIVGDNCVASDFQVDGDAGNTGDGIQVLGGRSVLRNIQSNKHGGNGIRIGDDNNDAINVNLWRLDNVMSIYNTGHGLYIHHTNSSTDATYPLGLPDVNAGTATALDLRQNGGDGLRIYNAIDNKFYGTVAQNNGGNGVKLLQYARGHNFYGLYTEANTTSEMTIDAGANQNLVIGNRFVLIGSGWVDNGSTNFILECTGNVSDPTAGYYAVNKVLAIKNLASGGTPALDFYSDTGANLSAAVFAGLSGTSGGKLTIRTKRDGNTGVDRFSIDDDGLAVLQNSTGMLFGKTVIDTTTAGIQIGDVGTGTNSRINMVGTGTAADTKISFYNANGQVGRIDTSGTATNYVVSSDYRLKTSAIDADGETALASVMSWPIKTFEWIADGSQDVGVISHELEAVKPRAVSGEKDAMRNGEIEPQGVDYSKLVPELVAAVQYLANRVKQLES